MSSSSPRVVGTLVGDIEHEPEARVKYGLLFEALGRRSPLVGVYDANLRGAARLVTALKSFRLGRRRWQERFRKDVTGFRLRSRHAAASLRPLASEADVILQVGALFDSRWNSLPLPSVIYTDYTVRLAARSPFQGYSPLSPRQRARRIELERQAYHRATHVLTRSERVRASMLTDYDLPSERVTAIGGGVNFPRLPVLPTGPADRSPTALFIGKSFYRKGGDLVLSAFAEARSRVPNARLVLVTGDEIPGDAPLDGATVVRSTWDRARIAELCGAADFLVLPSRRETWGDVLLEAMAYGLPCVGVHGEAMEEIIAHGETGLLVAPEDVGGLSAAMSELFLDRRRCRQWGLAARQRVEAWFTWERVVERMIPFLEEAAGTGG